MRTEMKNIRAGHGLPSKAVSGQMMSWLIVHDQLRVLVFLITGEQHAAFSVSYLAV